MESYRNVHTIFCGAAPLGAPAAVKLLERFNNLNISFQEGKRTLLASSIIINK